MKIISNCLLLLSVFMLLSCKENKSKTILGEWHGTKWENPTADSFYEQSQLYIDTFGKNHTDQENIALYQYANVDSIRKELQVQHDSARLMQNNAVLGTVFDFQQDSMVYITFGAGAAMDTSKWYIDKDDNVVMEDMNTLAKGNIAKLKILGLKKDELKLQIEDQGTRSSVTFGRASK